MVSLGLPRMPFDVVKLKCQVSRAGKLRITSEPREESLSSGCKIPGSTCNENASVLSVYSSCKRRMQAATFAPICIHK